MDQSILNTIKHMIGVENFYDAFDQDLIVSINSALMYLSQLGNFSTLFSISSSAETWLSLGCSENLLDSVKQYVFLRTRLAFDPPSTSFQIDAIEKQIRELEWRINIQSESKVI